MGKKKSCPLCQAKKKTYWYYNDERIWIADCDICNVPMAVTWRHTMKPTSEEETWMMLELSIIGDNKFGAGNWYIDKKQRKIKDHLHYHLRRCKERN